MKNRDMVVEKLAKIGYETYFEDKWDDLYSNSIERKMWLDIADNMLSELQKIWELNKGGMS